MDAPNGGVLVHTAGFVIGSLGLLLSIVTSAVDAVLGPETTLALSRTLCQSDSRELLQPPNRRLPRVSSDTSLALRRRRALDLPSISITLHKTGDSLCTHGSISLTPPAPPPQDQEPERKLRSATVSFAPTPTQLRNPLLRDPQWLALPPASSRTARSKERKRHALNRSTSSPQLSALHSTDPDTAGCAPTPPLSAPPQQQRTTDSPKKQKKGKLCLHIGKTEDEWQKVEVNEDGSPAAVPSPLAATASVQSDLVSETAYDSSTSSSPRRPPLRKVKTLGDLLRRVPNTPGPTLPCPQKLELTAKKALAFACPSSPNNNTNASSNSNSRSTSKHRLTLHKAQSSNDVSSSAVKEPKFSLSIKSPRTRRSKSPSIAGGDGHRNHASESDCHQEASQRKQASPPQRKRTQPYEAPYFWVPPDHEQWTRGRSDGEGVKEVRRGASVPRVASPVRGGA